MHPLALELDQRLQSLDPVTAAKCERLTRDLFDLLEWLATQGAGQQPASSLDYKLPAFSLGLEPGVEPIS